jgi:hypothetical protein
MYAFETDGPLISRLDQIALLPSESQDPPSHRCTTVTVVLVCRHTQSYASSLRQSESRIDSSQLLEIASVEKNVVFKSSPTQAKTPAPTLDHAGQLTRQVDQLMAISNSVHRRQSAFKLP